MILGISGPKGLLIDLAIIGAGISSLIFGLGVFVGLWLAKR